jgi:5-amino-6-(5-phospho-D-ribitylamino)uracil phosphatase
LTPTTTASATTAGQATAAATSAAATELPPSPPAPEWFRLVALDIDGTILNPDGHVSPRVRRAIQAVLDRGVLVVLCTGRAFSRGVKGLAEELGLSLPAIVRNGTAVQDSRTGAVLERYPITPAACTAALDVMLRHGLSPIVEEGPEHGDGLYTLPADRLHPAVAYYADVWQRTEHLRHVAVDELYRVRDTNWIGGCGDRARVRAAYEALQSIPGVDASFYGVWQPDDALHCTGIAPKGCSKASALARFAAARGIGLDETLAIGDYLNDIEMLAEVGWGVAMGHAPDAVKAVAKAVAPDNAQDGAAVALERYVLGHSAAAARDAHGASV